MTSLRRIAGRSPPRRRAQRGYATVWATAWVAVLLALGFAVMLMTAAVARQHRLDGAADLAALSAAAAVQRGGDGCLVARQIAAANGVTLSLCTRDGDNVTVRVTDRLDLPVGPTIWIGAAARAGPDDTVGG